MAVILFTVTVTAASAVTLNPRGIGQVLIYPYYTVNNSQDTYVSVVNTADVGKVVTVEFLEGYNGRPVLDFLVFLSAHDVWTGVVSQTASDGGAKLVSQDHSCVVPSVDGDDNDIRGDGLPFSTVNYDGSGPFGADGGPVSVTRTREGHIEIFADADIVPGSPTDLKITHVQDGSANGGTPTDCTGLTSLVAGDLDLVAPTSGLYGSGSIINVGEGTFFAYDANALSGFTSKVLLDNLGSRVSLTQANSLDSTFDSGATATILLGSGEPMTINYERGIDAVSAVFMADAIYNDYLTSPALGAATDWVVTFPTKRFYVDPYYNENDTSVFPFYEAFHSPGQSDISLHAEIYDDEEGATATYPPPNGCGFICPGGEFFTLPYEVNVVGIAGSAIDDVPVGVLGSSLRTLLYPFPLRSDQVAGGDSGAIKLELLTRHPLAAGINPAGTLVPLNGLPVAGFMVENVINAQAQAGKLANYSGLSPHRMTISCEPDIYPPVPDPCS